VVFLFKPLSEQEVVGIPLMTTAVVKKLALVETCSWYDIAPLTAFHDRLGFIGMLVVPFAGESSVGARNGASGVSVVVKLQIAEGTLVPPVFAAVTRQK
jgi:hypothetical protein